MDLKCCKDKKYVFLVAVARELDISVQAVHQFLKRQNIKASHVSIGWSASWFLAKDVQQAYKYWKPRRSWK